MTTYQGSRRHEIEALIRALSEGQAAPGPQPASRPSESGLVSAPSAQAAPLLRRRTAA